MSSRGRGRGGRGRGARSPRPLPEVQIKEYDMSALNADADLENEDSIYINPKCTSFEDLIDDSYKHKIDAIQSIYMKGNIQHPSYIQTRAIPYLLENPPKSILAQASTGEGKTLAFILPMYLRVDLENPNIQAICVCPTRELIQQAYDWMMDVSALNRVTILELMRTEESKEGQEESKEGQEVSKEGQEVSKEGQEEAREEKSAQVIIGTPSQISKLPRDTLRSVKICVFDEADNIFNSEQHKHYAQRIINNIPDTSQVAFFSATYPKQVKIHLEHYISRDLIPITIQRKDQIGLINNVFTCCDRSEVDDLLIKALRSIQISSAFIFVSRKVDTEKYKNLLIQNGFTATVLTADLSSSQRDQNLKDFKEGKVKFLVTVNIFGRGIDIPSATHIFNIDLPVPEVIRRKVNQREVIRRFTDVDSYVHRAGRAGRFGKKGCAFTFVTSDRDFKSICLISRMLSAPFYEIKKEQIDNFEFRHEIDPQDVKNATKDMTDNDVKALANAIEEQPEEPAAEAEQPVDEAADAPVAE
ncbi:Helicase conserved C-terminal domain containing protein [Trichomonas vaginalis G3]|uniref:RNA helicase n=1 Tax=Trichomonas vaginalis (strain ATCC PRA-98 / G3) TaxID=412133 RepID=A2E7Z7_TRIV3|nr:helicase [Trichomonas vaginalis G3]EAY11223.1 Helicase conserved C-terminal domain containing protein [Trichomonas vaginalis G3]KAI5551397.1 RNA helicase protein [Trichomonas vaginalis G3]|eukprot:XP_001323446.1 helicase [Trichomonas vaginalis G3]